MYTHWYAVEPGGWGRLFNFGCQRWLREESTILPSRRCCDDLFRTQNWENRRMHLISTRRWLMLTPSILIIIVRCHQGHPFIKHSMWLGPLFEPSIQWYGDQTFITTALQLLTLSNQALFYRRKYHSIVDKLVLGFEFADWQVALPVKINYNGTA